MPDQHIINTNKQKLIIYIFLAAFTLAAYLQVNGFDFINFDDDVYVAENIHIQYGLTSKGVSWAFSTKYFHLWTPLVWLSFMLDYQLYGLNAGGYHITNLILHILSTLLLFWLFARMTRQIWPSAFVAAFFALHPLHVESVAWVSERKDVLSAFFWMLTLCLYVYYTEKPVIKRYLLVLFSFVLALMSKPMVVTLPLIMILLDYWPLGRFDFKKDGLLFCQLKEKLPFVMLSAILIFVILYTPHEQKTYIKYFPLSCRFANAPVAFVTYLGKTFWPHNLGIFYPFPTYIPVWQIIGSLLLITLTMILIILTSKNLPYLLTGWFWYTLTIFPAIGLIQIGDFSMTDRYHYLPSIGIGIMLAWGISFIFKQDFLRKKILFPLTIIILFILTGLTWKQCGYWKDNISLWNHALSVTNNNYMAHNNLADALLKQEKTDKAIYHYNKAIAINDYSAAHYNKGVICFRQGQHQQAIMNFHEAIRVKPDYAEAYYNLGIIFQLSGQYQPAIENYSKAIHIIPNHIKAYNNRAFIYLKMGNSISGCSDAIMACSMGSCQALIWAQGNGQCN